MVARPHLMLFVFNIALFGCFMLHITVRFILYCSDIFHFSKREAWWGLIDVLCKCFSDTRLKSNKEQERATNVSVNSDTEACGSGSHTPNDPVLSDAAVWRNPTPRNNVVSSGGKLQGWSNCTLLEYFFIWCCFILLLKAFFTPRQTYTDQPQH